MSEKPGAQTPWTGINQLLALDERFEVHSSHGQGFLLAPKHSSQLAALLYFLHQEGVAFDVQGRGSIFRPKHSIIVSTRAFSQIVWHDHGVVEVGAGCSLAHLHQFLLERKQEVSLEGDLLTSSKRSIGGVILSGRNTMRYREESFPETILGLELVTREGGQIKWGAPYRSAVAGPALHKLIWGLHGMPSVIVKVMLKTFPIPPVRLRLAWSFPQRESLWKQFEELKHFSASWEYLDVVLSGRPGDQGLVFAQIAGFPEEMEAFSHMCSNYTAARQQGERMNLKKFLSQQNLKIFSAALDQSLEVGEYLWVQNWNQAVWWLTERGKENPYSASMWKERFWEAFSSGVY